MSRDERVRWALLGDHLLVDPLIERLANDTRFSFACGVCAPRLRDRAKLITQGVRFTDRWETLMEDESLSLIVVATDRSELLEGAKLLANMGRTLAILPLAELGTSWIHEMSLVRDEGTASLLTIWPTREHRGITVLQERIKRGDLGRVLELQFTRGVKTEMTGGQPGLIAARQLDDLFLHDADLICQLIGEPTHVTSVVLGQVEGTVSRALSTIASKLGTTASWEMHAAVESDGWQLTVRGEKCSAQLNADGAANSATLKVGNDAVEYSSAAIEQSIAEGLNKLVAECLTATAGVPVTTTSIDEATRGGHADWSRALSNYEMLDASYRSRRRRRTIELLGETPSERSQFKAQMAAVGCGLLMATLMGVVGLLLLGAFVDSPSPEAQQARRHDALFPPHEFADRSPDLTSVGSAHFERVVPLLGDESWPIVIEASGEGSDHRELAESRRRSMIENLRGLEITDPERRVYIEPVKSPWMRMLLSWGRVLVFLPLFLYLAMQGLFVLTRPAANQRANDAR